MTSRESGLGQTLAKSCFRFGWQTFALPLLSIMMSCGSSDSKVVDAGPGIFDAQIGWARGVDLPTPSANNALASVEKEGGCMVFSFLGIGAALDRESIVNHAYRLREGDSKWIQMPDIPGPGRLAANAVGLRGDPYLLGGYDVAASGQETSHSSLQRFDLKNGKWVDMANLLTPIDDAGVAVWRDRYIVVVSGWSNSSNEEDVQIYDVETDAWILATAFPGTPVFGGSAAIVNDELIFIDGVKSGLGGFSLVNQVWRGVLHPANPENIEWTSLGEHPGPARYRSAPVTSLDGSLWFHGGTKEPYNYNGLRYDNGEPATPLATTLRYKDGVFSLDRVPVKPEASMDHRAMVLCGSRLMSVGGLSLGPKASVQTWSIIPDNN